MGLRREGGDAETGAGMDMASGLAFTNAVHGVVAGRVGADAGGVPGGRCLRPNIADRGPSTRVVWPVAVASRFGEFAMVSQPRRFVGTSIPWPLSSMRIGPVASTYLRPQALPSRVLILTFTQVASAS